jgi:2-methylcitrate synthase
LLHNDFRDEPITGWTAHIMEQTASNALIRPLSEYVGPPQRELAVAR